MISGYSPEGWKPNVRQPIIYTMDEGKKHAPAGWLEALAISEAELTEGRTVPAEPIFQRLQESIDQLEKRPAQPPQRRRTASQR